MKVEGSTKITVEIEGEQIARVLKYYLELCLSGAFNAGYVHPNDYCNYVETAVALKRVIEYLSTEKVSFEPYFKRFKGETQ